MLLKIYFKRKEIIMSKFDKILVFDMDGTLFDFYGVPNWHDAIYVTFETTPYAISKPMYDPKELNAILHELKRQGWYIVINTWLCQTEIEEFHEAIRNVKLQRLAEIEFPYDFFIATKYGVDKQAPFANIKNGIQIIVDDSAAIRDAWNGPTIDATQNIIPALKQLLITEKEILYV